MKQPRPPLAPGVFLALLLATVCTPRPAGACDVCVRAMVVYYMPWHWLVLGVAVAWHLRAAALCRRADVEPALMFRGKGSLAFVGACLLAQITGTTSILSIPALLLGPLLLWLRAGAPDFPEAWRRPFRAASRAFAGACAFAVVAGHVLFPVTRVQMLTTLPFAGTGPGRSILNAMMKETPLPATELVEVLRGTDDWTLPSLAKVVPSLPLSPEERAQPFLAGYERHWKARLDDIATGGDGGWANFGLSRYAGALGTVTGEALPEGSPPEAWREVVARQMAEAASGAGTEETAGSGS